MYLLLSHNVCEPAAPQNGAVSSLVLPDSKQHDGLPTFFDIDVTLVLAASTESNTLPTVQKGRAKTKLLHDPAFFENNELPDIRYLAKASSK
ncbi:hypothetical protein PI126_g16476 [Phytophthora idaei]|nr:hypothetical protein PI126_g16476 [Phytophthora idaei]